jgi:hypothetical protein
MSKIGAKRQSIMNIRIDGSVAGFEMPPRGPGDAGGSD